MTPWQLGPTPNHLRQLGPTPNHLDEEDKVGWQFSNLETLDVRVTMSLIFLNMEYSQLHRGQGFLPPCMSYLLLHAIKLGEEVKERNLRDTVTLHIILNNAHPITGSHDAQSALSPGREGRREGQGSKRGRVM
jgi:hypothetical protein